jgi:hypothetical protein
MRFQIFIFFTTCLVTAHNLYARDEQWFTGYVILKSQAKLHGKLLVRVDYNVVMFRQGDELVVYPAHKVESVTVYDQSLKHDRNFISIEEEVCVATLHQLYEVVLKGEVTVLRKERVLWYTVHLDIPEEDYFVWNSHEMISLYRFKRKVFPGIVKASHGSMKSYMRRHKLNPNRVDDMIEILAHYNQQKLDESQFAKNEQHP